MATPRAPHPWNSDFTWTEHGGPFTTITDAQAKQFDEDGFFVVEDAFDAETLEQINAAIAPGEARVKEFLEAQPGRAVRRRRRGHADDRAAPGRALRRPARLLSASRARGPVP